MFSIMLSKQAWQDQYLALHHVDLSYIAYTMLAYLSRKHMWPHVPWVSLAMLLKQKGYDPVLYERTEEVTSAGLSLAYAALL